ncbi:MAG: VanZ family protein [Brevundimonas sp.]|uniref:VanZ family protein n=1 Tax=Brevundimonas sp. TaxID=1871086 RepID=UPI002734A481|nr:VanZ family protein [Brevundimonas sp.]MDP3377315.1 VanZ family protein [Brevundimonas sp.]
MSESAYGRPMLWLARLMAALATLATLWLAFEPPGDGPGLIPWDKAGHFLSFYVLTILYLLAAPRAPRWAIVALLVAAGGVIEIVQGQVGRNAEWADWLADIAGIACAVLPVWLEALRRWMRG